ncbi:thiamine diphosphokinase [Lacihabitans soyangensis]|uniref:Thiamine diphosphokinase n=1 Tax=Lacihabitans soyangensis TaxID=869394 RepID=A0AAE3H7A5_9BACT|nr:thiamine diphosphokinase [Lacihabitans soyangensis]MCP9765386.1 thiamine diphosphokinase [Lacihabitans soyangensis]
MSSHHIVREKQEPALIIANGEACNDELLGQLLEWSPFVLVLDGAIDRVLSLGIKIDVLFGDFDHGNKNFEELKTSQFPIEIIHAPDQEKTDLEKAIEFLIERDFPAANIAWATGKRADHTMANIAILPKYSSLIKLKIVDDHSCIFPILPLPNTFTKWYKKGSIISLMPVGEATGITTHNLKYPLNGETLKLGYRNGNSNEAHEDGQVQISYQSGDMLIMECKD